MKLYIQTDLEGVAGVINVADYLGPDGRCYEVGRRLLTAEVNAAVRGFAAGGFDDIVVADGHGAGAVNMELLDTRVRLMRGWPTGWPLLLDGSYNALAFVGQHSKACTPFGHIPHTQSWHYVDLSLNGISIGEYGQLVLCAQEMKVPVIMGAGDAAFCREALALTPWVETAVGKQGTTPTSGEELDEDAYAHSHETAIHWHPEVVRGRIEAAALKAARRFAADRSQFGFVDIRPPYRLVARFRRRRDAEPRQVVRDHPSSIIEVMNMR